MTSWLSSATIRTPPPPRPSHPISFTISHPYRYNHNGFIPELGKDWCNYNRTQSFRPTLYLALGKV